MRQLRELFRTQPLYDARPWIFMALGLYAMVSLRNSFIGELSGILLTANSILIFYMRNSAKYDVRRGAEVHAKRGTIDAPARFP